MTTLEDFLPAANTPYSLVDLLNGFGKYWTQQPSLSKYKRYYTASIKNLVLWEGYPGAYDSYGSFEEDDDFYNEVVREYMFLRHVGVKEDGTIQIWDTTEQIYLSLPALRYDMITQWGNLQPPVSEQWVALQNFIQEHQPKVVSLLKTWGGEWTHEAFRESRQYRVYAIENFVYLIRWLGDPDAVQRPSDYDPELQGHPQIKWHAVDSLCSFRVALKRLPVRFSLETPYWRGLGIGAYGYLAEDASSLKSWSDFETTLKRKLSDIPFTKRSLKPRP